MRSKANVIVDQVNLIQFTFSSYIADLFLIVTRINSKLRENNFTTVLVANHAKNKFRSKSGP